MDARAKKAEIIKTLEQSDDEQLIEEVYDLIRPDKAIEDVPITMLPEQLQEKLKRGLDDYKEGR